MKENKLARRIIALFVLLLPVSLLLMIVVRGYADFMYDQFDQAKLLQRHHQRLEYLEKNSEKIAAMYKSYRTNRFVRTMFVSSTNSIDPLRVLQSEIDRIKNSSCNLSYQKGAVRQTNADYAIRLSVETECNLHELYNLIVQVDNLSPLVLIEAIDISALDNKYDTRVKAVLRLKAYVI